MQSALLVLLLIALVSASVATARGAPHQVASRPEKLAAWLDAMQTRANARDADSLVRGLAALELLSLGGAEKIGFRAAGEFAEVVWLVKGPREAIGYLDLLERKLAAVPAGTEAEKALRGELRLSIGR